MKNKRLDKAMLIVQAEHAWDSPPPPSHPEVKACMSLDNSEFEEKHKWAVGAMSAMRWNTMTARCWK